jgi:hypothetical protein
MDKSSSSVNSKKELASAAHGNGESSSRSKLEGVLHRFQVSESEVMDRSF